MTISDHSAKCALDIHRPPLVAIDRRYDLAPAKALEHGPIGSEGEFSSVSPIFTLSYHHVDV